LFADNGNVTPGLQVYNDLSFSDVSWSNALVSAVNSVVDNKTKADITLDSLHSIANAYENILNEATNSISNSNPDPTLADYETVTGSHLHVFTVGSNVEPTLAANALALMNQVVLHKTANALNTQVAVETLATQVDSLMHLASGTGSITFSALASMGFDIPSGWSDVNTPNKIKEFARLVDVSANSGADINTWDKVNDLIHAASVIAA
jgi:hypothetical protein